MSRDDYITLIDQQIKHKKALDTINRELDDHIEDQKQCFINSGMNPSNAEEAAIMEMGDPVSVGIELDAIHRPHMPWKLLITSVLVGFIGYLLQVLLWSKTGHNIYLPVIGYHIAGLILLSIMCFLDYTSILRYSKQLYLIFCTFIIIIVLCLKYIFHTVFTWIGTGYLTFNLATILLLSVPLYCGILFQLKMQKKAVIIRSFIWMLPALFCAVLLRRMITVGLLFTIFLLCLSIAIGKEWFDVPKRKAQCHLWSGYLLTGIMYVVFIRLFGTQRQQVLYLSLIDYKDCYSISIIRHLINSSFWIGNSHQTSQLNRNLDATNYLATFISTNYGILAMILFFAVFSIFLTWLLIRSLRQKNQLGMLVATGSSIIFVFQFAVWALGNVGLVQLYTDYQSDLCCPFITYEGTESIIIYLLLGIIICVIRNRDVLSDRKIKYAKT